MDYSVSAKGAKGGNKKGGYVGDSGVAIGIQEPFAPTNGKGKSSKKNYTSMY